MASVSSLGIGSGLDLASIVTGLVGAERAPTESRLAAKEQDITADLSAFGLLRSSLSTFQGSLASLTTSTAFNAKSITTSDASVFTTTLSNTAAVGSYSVETTALAKTHSLATNSATAFTSPDDIIGTGTLTIKFGTTTTGPYSFTQDTSKATQAITVSAANQNTTVSGLRDYINANAFGVQAAVVNDGNGYRLTLTSKSTGAQNSMEITVTSDGDADDTDNAGLSQLAFNASAQGSLEQTVAAQDAALKINGLNITRETNTVEDAIDGVTLNLLKADVGNTVLVNVTENNDTAKDSIQGLVDGYNSLIETLNTLTNYNPETSEAGVLIGDFTVRNIRAQLRGVIGNTVSQLTGNVRLLADIGITTNSDGTLTLDSSKLSSVIASNPSEVQALFAFQGRPTDPDISYSASTASTLAGNYDVDITTIATQGVFNGATVNSLDIDVDNDEFTIIVDGVTSESITLSQGTYASGAILAAHIQAQINDDANLKAAGVSVVVAHDTINNEFDITSQRYGSASKVEFFAIDTNTTTDLGFSGGGGGIDGLDVAGTINGFAATGSGQVLTSTASNSNGLALLISAGSTGNRGTVSFSRGMAETLDSLIGNLLKTDGLIESRENGLQKGLDDIADDRTQLEIRISSIEARLIRQFSTLDQLVSNLKTTSSFLSSQLANLPGNNGGFGNNS